MKLESEIGKIVAKDLKGDLRDKIVVQLIEDRITYLRSEIEMIKLSNPKPGLLEETNNRYANAMLYSYRNEDEFLSSILELYTK